jgi:hypothetical protein
MKKIGILGSGIVAKTLGSGFIKHGYSVMLGTRDSDKLKDWLAENGNDARVGSFEDAARFGDIIVLAVKGIVAGDAIDLAGPQNLHFKTVIDTTNPIAPVAPEDGVLRYFSSINESLMEQLQNRFPEVHFVKAFNSVGSAHMVNPSMTEKPTMFICGNNIGSRKHVADILHLFGWDVADMGRATAARAIEPLCMLWCIPYMQDGVRNHAFRLITS